MSDCYLEEASVWSTFFPFIQIKIILNFMVTYTCMSMNTVMTVYLFLCYLKQWQFLAHDEGDTEVDKDPGWIEEEGNRKGPFLPKL